MNVFTYYTRTHLSIYGLCVRYNILRQSQTKTSRRVSRDVTMMSREKPLMKLRLKLCFHLGISRFVKWISGIPIRKAGPGDFRIDQRLESIDTLLRNEYHVGHLTCRLSTLSMKIISNLTNSIGHKTQPNRKVRQLDMQMIYGFPKATLLVAIPS